MQLQRLVVNPGQLKNGRFQLAPAQQHYLMRVLRLSKGDRLIVMDGIGHAWLGTLIQGTDSLITDSLIEVQILEPITAHTELPIRITLVAALPKGNSFDEVVRQATELGVDQILPVMSDRTLLQPSPQKVERWQRIANEAAEQSERLCVPRIDGAIPFAEHLQRESGSLQATERQRQKYLCVARGTAPHLIEALRVSLSDTSVGSAIGSDVGSLVIAIGPEGGWTEAEVEQAIAAGYQPVSLGTRILRAVTAPLVALSLVAAVYEHSTPHSLTPSHHA